MKVKKWVECSQEVEIKLGIEDIGLILYEAGSASEVLKELNLIAEFLIAVPEKLIAEMSVGQREIIEKFFERQSLRFKP